jgi:hypothetical protein
MMSPDRPTKMGSHGFNLPAVGRRGQDYEGFFITQKAGRRVMLNAPNHCLQTNL